MLPFLASFVRLLCWTSLGGRSLPKGNSFPSRSSALLSDKISGENIPKNFFFFAVRTGLEPATPGVTGRYSNQLNYRTNCSDLYVFVKRGCKGTHFFETCKFFSKKIRIFCKKVMAAPISANRHRMLIKPKPMKTNLLSNRLHYLTSMILFSFSTFSTISLGILTLRTPFSTHASILSFSAFSGRIKV